MFSSTIPARRTPVEVEILLDGTRYMRWGAFINQFQVHHRATERVRKDMGLDSDERSRSASATLRAGDRRGVRIQNEKHRAGIGFAQGWSLLGDPPGR